MIIVTLLSFLGLQLINPI